MQSHYVWSLRCSLEFLLLENIYLENNEEEKSDENRHNRIRNY